VNCWGERKDAFIVGIWKRQEAMRKNENAHEIGWQVCRFVCGIRPWCDESVRKYWRRMKKRCCVG